MGRPVKLMKKTTKIPATLSKRLEKHAKAVGLTQAEIMIEALKNYL